MGAITAAGACIIGASCLWSVSSSAAEPTIALCEAARHRIDVDARVKKAVEASFPNAGFIDKLAQCTYPLRVIGFPDAEVLLFLDSVPGQACRQCHSHISAVVLTDDHGRLTVRKRLPGFAEGGVFGFPGKITPISVGRGDGLAIQNGGESNGYGYTVLRLYAFTGQNIVFLTAEKPLILDLDQHDFASKKDAGPTVVGDWSISKGDDPSLVVRYDILSSGHHRKETLVWRMSGSNLKLSEGVRPPELALVNGD